MPLVKKILTIAPGATSEQVLLGTTYEYVDQGTQIVVAAAESTTTSNVEMDFSINNTEYSKDARVSALVTGEPFGWRGNYVLNDTITTGQQRNRPVITFRNLDGTVTATVHVAVFIAG